MKRMFAREYNSGFTFIEILITLTILAMVVSASTYFYMSAQIDSRDARRKSDLAQIQLALESYKADNSTYPESDLGELSTGLYIGSVPVDPSGFNYTYVGLDDETSQGDGCGSDCQTYRLMARLEGGGDTCGDSFSGECNSGAASCNYCLTPLGEQ